MELWYVGDVGETTGRVGRVDRGLLLVEGPGILLQLLLGWRGVWFLFSVWVVVREKGGGR